MQRHHSTAVYFPRRAARLKLSSTLPFFLPFLPLATEAAVESFSSPAAAFDVVPAGHATLGDAPAPTLEIPGKPMEAASGWAPCSGKPAPMGAPLELGTPMACDGGLDDAAAPPPNAAGAPMRAPLSRDALKVATGCLPCHGELAHAIGPVKLGALVALQGRLDGAPVPRSVVVADLG
mmetsp:Transcript_6364/g.16959  ORF Transcript_6364/g.16959 Transcript_6364/m.16959 type:complete len:178 (-) Transcript_6364:3918-4451(-)